MESNPIARALMCRLGIRGTVWFAFRGSGSGNGIESALCSVVDSSTQRGIGPMYLRGCLRQ